MSLFIELGRFLVRVAILVVEALFWLGHGTKVLLQITGDARRARALMPGGELHCPAGHLIPTEGEVYQCTKCGFTYQGSIFVCGNPECGLVAPYVDCPTCGLSVRNPYRLGRA